VAPADAPTRLLLVRHGETDWNAEGRWQGQGGVGLNALGARQAAATAAHLAAVADDVALLARSDSQRVEESAAPIAARLGVPVVVDPRLREVDVGRWSGRTRPEVEAAEPEAFAAYRRGERDVRVGGGETIAEVEARMVAALRDVAAAARGRTAVVVTHGWALRLAVAGLLGADRAAAEAMARAGNCSITELLVEGGAAELVGYAAAAHLEATPLAAPAGRLA
jgi:glucosyl-3-phosphoglycerate phosphatase